MATQSTGGGSVVSFGNTPQAGDDLFAFTEDAANILIINVMANDLGGGAKTLFSLDDGTSASASTKNYAPADLLVKDTVYSTDAAAMAAASTDRSNLGARIWIGSDGNVHYDKADINGLLQGLAVGQSLTDTFTYAIRLGNGTLSWATVTLQFSGLNDGPSITVAGGDSASATKAETNAGLTASGTLTVVDPDVSDTVTMSVTGVTASGPTGGLGNNQLLSYFSLGQASLGADPGSSHNLSWIFNSGGQAFDFLAQGQSLTLTYTVRADDGHGGIATQPVTITVTGTNDAPTLTATASGAVTEDTPAGPTETASGTISFADVDLTDSHTLAASFVTSTNAGGAQLGSLSVAKTADTSNGTGGAGTWTYSVGNAALQFLAAGQSIQETYQVTVDDGHGGTATQNVVVTITGTNDDPTLTVTATGAVTEDMPAGPSETASGTISFADVDLTDSHTLAASFVSSTNAGGTQLGSLSVAKTTDTTNGTGGAGTWSYSVGNAALQFLAVGQSIQETYSVTVDDGQGGTAMQNVVVTITGTNDAPTLTVTATGAVTEDTPAGLTETAVGTISFADVDLTDSHTLAASFISSTHVGGQLGSLAVTKTADTTNGTGGAGSWSYSVNNTALQFLAAGQTVQETYQVTVDDGQGGTATQNVVVTITGTNDDPTLTVTATGAVTEDTPAGPSETASGTISFVDVDLTDSHTLAASFFSSTHAGGQLGSLTVVKSTDTTNGTGGAGTWSYSVGNMVLQFLAAGQTVQETYQVTVDDGQGGTATQNVVVTITGTNDDPTLTVTATGAVTEDTPAGSTETASGTIDFADVDLTDSHSLSASFVSSTNAGGAQLGSLTVAKTADTTNGTGGAGTWTYSVGNAALQFLAAGQSIQETYQVTVDDGHGGTATQNIVVTITGTNDAPVMTAASPSLTTITAAQTTNGGQTVASILGASVSDVDQGAIQGIAITGSTASNGNWQFSINNGTTWTNFASYSTASALLLSSSDLVRFSPNGTNASTDTFSYVAWDQTSGTHGGTVNASIKGGSTAFSTQQNTATISVTAAGQAPVVDLNGGGAGNDATASYPKQTTPILIASSATISDADSANLTSMVITITNPQDNSTSQIREILSLSSSAQTTATNAGLTVSFTPTIANNTDPVTLTITGSASVATYQTVLRGLQYADTKPGAHISSPARNVDVTVSDGSNTSVVHHITISVAAPAGIAGQPINLGLSQYADGLGDVAINIANLPADWILSAGARNADGSWTVHTTNVAGLTVTTPSSYTGAMVLDMAMSWINADGSAGTALIANNVEAYVSGSPIFAWSGDDHLTGSSGDDLFVFSQPIGRDTVHDFDAAADKIDLIGYAGFKNFADVQAHLANDTAGNATITLADGQSITLNGVQASGLTADNFVFDQTPVTNNAGEMTIADGAMLPLSGIVNNTGTISLDSAGSGTLLQLIQHGITLEAGGQIILSDSDANVISGTLPSVTLTNVDNTISGAGQIGAGTLTLVNDGTIVATGTHALVIDTGMNAVVNSGTLKATGSGGLLVNSALDNAGLIWAYGGDITVNGQVTGSGTALISGIASITFGSASTANTTIAGDASGTLVLADSFHFGGSISGFNGDDHLDLLDVSFGTGTTVNYAANQDGTGGTLTVSDGAHSVNIALLGQYDPGGFLAGSDHKIGTLITYDPHQLV